MLWNILGILAILALIVFWRGPNAVWGAATFGLIAGTIAGVVAGLGLEWSIIKKWLIWSILAGALLETVWSLQKRKKNQ